MTHCFFCLDPVGISVTAQDHISRISWPIFTKFSWHDKELIRFGNLIPIFKATVGPACVLRISSELLEAWPLYCGWDGGCDILSQKIVGHTHFTIMG